MREFIFSTLIHSRTYIQAVFLIVTENMNSRRYNQIRTSCQLSRIDVSVMFSPFSKKKSDRTGCRDYGVVECCFKSLQSHLGSSYKKS